MFCMTGDMHEAKVYDYNTGTHGVVIPADNTIGWTWAK